MEIPVRAFNYAIWKGGLQPLKVVDGVYFWRKGCMLWAAAGQKLPGSRKKGDEDWLGSGLRGRGGALRAFIDFVLFLTPFKLHTLIVTTYCKYVKKEQTE